MSKAISKPLLDEAIKQARFWFDVNVPTKEKDVHKYLDTCKAAEPDEMGDYMLDNLFSAILRYRGLKPDATNEDIYKVLKFFGWTVTDDEQAEC